MCAKTPRKRVKIEFISGLFVLSDKPGVPGVMIPHGVLDLPVDEALAFVNGELARAAGPSNYFEVNPEFC